MFLLRVPVAVGDTPPTGVAVVLDPHPARLLVVVLEGERRPVLTGHTGRLDVDRRLAPPPARLGQRVPVAGPCEW